MRVLFGTAFYGKIASLSQQWVETKFFHVWFIPLFPISSILVTAKEFNSRRGIELPLSRKSVCATYMRLVTLLLSLWYLAQVTGVFSVYFYSTVEEARTAYLWLCAKAIISLTACIYLFFFFGKTSPQEAEIREKVGSVTGIYALPEWFDYIEAKDKLRTFLYEYKIKYPDADWVSDLQSATLIHEKIPHLYAIALFNCMVYDLPENEQLYFKADGLYNPSAMKIDAGKIVKPDTADVN
ncbi:hypothetical protein [Desertivirga arenae]|uniref:hypothetical protein n=1 Tax=Desertivirga arenae TaxID=2810309 RepID=UPI001A95EBFE|nr:hypothetical protein [Pedobacter sp. SYSU D00823]